MAAGRRRSWIAIGGATAAVAIGAFAAVALGAPINVASAPFTNGVPQVAWGDDNVAHVLSYDVDRASGTCATNPTFDPPSLAVTSPFVDPSPPGNGIWCYRVTGHYDNAGDAPATTQVMVDTVLPTVQLTSPVAGYVRGVVSIQANASDADSGLASITLSVDGQGFSPPPQLSPAIASWSTVALNVPDGPYTVRAVVVDNAGNSFANTVNVVVDNTPPAAPGVHALQSPVAGNPTLVWNPVPGETYNISRDGSSVATGVTSGLWTNPVPALAPGTYTYVVTAIDPAGNSTPSAPISVTVIPPSVTAPRSIAASSPTNTTPHLTWQPPVTFAVLNYQVYRDGAPLAPLLPASAGTFDDTSLTAQGPHIYTVQAVNGGSSGDMSSPVAVTYDTIAPALDPATATANPNGSISVNWPAAVDPDPGSGISTYVVRRGSGSSAPLDVSGGTGVCTLTAPDTGCVDSTAKSGTSYGYAVFAVDAANNRTRREASAKASDTQPPDAVAGLKVVSFDRTYARLGWTVPALKGTDSDLAGYKVLRLRPGAKAPLNPQDGTVVCRNDDPKDNICDALKLTTGKRVWFAVYAHDEVPNYSAPMVVSIVPHSVDRKAPHKPTKVKLARDGLSYTLTWVSPRDRDLSKFRVTLYDKKPAPRPSKGKAIVTGRVLHATFTLKPGKRVYVNLFALDVVGNFSRVSKLIVTPQIVAKSKHKTTQQKPTKKKPAKKKAVPEKPVSVSIQKA